jgi:hypothetical protein
MNLSICLTVMAALEAAIHQGKPFIRARTRAQRLAGSSPAMTYSGVNVIQLHPKML